MLFVRAIHHVKHPKVCKFSPKQRLGEYDPESNTNAHDTGKSQTYPIVRLIIGTCCMLLSAQYLSAQDSSEVRFGNITPKDFDVREQKFDSGANAIIITDIGSTTFEGNTFGLFTLVYKHFMRVKIMNKNGFDIGSQEIFLRNNGEGKADKITLKGITYNLENGEIKATHLDDQSVYSEKFSKYLDLKKFSMPALKEGSVFDLEYTVRSPFELYLRPWEFQGEYPRMQSEYDLLIAPPFHYITTITGDQNFDVNTTKEHFEKFYLISGNGGSESISGNAIERKWVKRNVPALRREAFTSTLNNYNSRVSFKLSYLQGATVNNRVDFNNTWHQISEHLMEDQYFGLTLDDMNAWMEDDLDNAVKGCNTEDEKTSKIYCFVRDNFKASSHSGLYVSSSLKDVFKKKVGNVADINLLLTAMLRKANIKADPLILSTKENGFANMNYPMMEDYNYVICVAHLASGDITLDASQPYNGFGNLPVCCYNGYGRIINNIKPGLMIFSSDSINDVSITNVSISNDEKGKYLGNCTTTYGKNSSYEERSKIKTTSIEEYKKKLLTTADGHIVIENFQVDSLNKYEYPFAVHYDFDISGLNKADIIYFDPMLNHGYKSNPFKSAERRYPVEMPYKVEDAYTLTMEIPAGYQIDELPKSAKVTYNEDEGVFEYIVEKNDTNIQMLVHLKFNKAFFPVEEYGQLRDFYSYVVKKESEQIVFKKIK